MCLNPYFTVEVNGKVKSLRYDKKKDIIIDNEDFFRYIDQEKLVLIPCGHCKECKKQKKINMYYRIKKEIELNKDNIFITLTYDNENKKDLNKKDIQNFLKRLRKKVNNIKYYCVGELGETTKRPHYHMIIFNYLPTDLKETNKTKSGYKQYTSDLINKTWGMGLTRISIMQKGLINYILKYIQKSNGIELYSRKPPIGIPKTENKEEFEKFKKEVEEKINVPQTYKRYYKYHIGEIQKSDERIKQEKDNKINKIKQINKLTKLKYFDYIIKKRDSA